MEEMKDIHDITAQLSPDYLILVLGGLLLVFVAVLIGFWLYNKLKSKSVPRPMAVPRKPLAQLKAETVAKLEALKATTHENEFEDYKNIFTTLSLIVREFLGEDLSIKATAMTKSELMGLKAKSLNDILNISYSVVFATYKVDKAFTEKTIDSSIQFVNQWNSGTRQ